MSAKIFDVIVIGSGSAGFSAAQAARAQGASVCLIEKERLGGECPNWACVPTKALLKTVDMLQAIQQARYFGIMVGSVRYDFSELMDYRKRAVAKVTGGGEGDGARYERLAKKLNITLIKGSARFVNDTTIEVGGQAIKAKAFVVATGASSYIPAISGLDKTKYWTFKDAVTTTRQPKSLGILGGGPVGCELATLFAGLGTRVVIFQRGPYVLSREDEELSAFIQQKMVAEGIEIVSGALVKSVMEGPGAFGVTVVRGGKQERFAVERLLVASGKQSNTKGLGLNVVGIALDERGVIKLDTSQRTSARHVFAAGDVGGGMQFTHTAHASGFVAGYNAALVALKKRSPLKKLDLTVVPRVTFVHPEIASVGMTAAEVKAKYKKALVGRYEMQKLGRAVTEGVGDGIIKLVAHPKTGKLLGGHIAGARAGEMIHEVALGIYLNTTLAKLGSMIHAFPTFSEGIAAASNSSRIE